MKLETVQGLLIPPDVEILIEIDTVQGQWPISWFHYDETNKRLVLGSNEDDWIDEPMTDDDSD